MFKRFLFLGVIISLFIFSNYTDISASIIKNTDFSDITNDFSWAKDSISNLAERGIISGIEGGQFAPSQGVTKEQLSKMLVLSFNIDSPEAASTYSDVSDDRWSVKYIEAAKGFYPLITSDDITKFEPSRVLSRQEVAAAIVLALSFNNDDIIYKNALYDYFKDESEVSEPLKSLITIAAERGIIRGDDAFLRPTASVTRAEVCVMLERGILISEKKGEAVMLTDTPIVGKSTVSLNQAKSWAESKNADQRFVDIADIYWKYGELTGIRPEILYAQAAKETNFGHYTGNVKPEQNNWAGIKIKAPTGDKPEDHESFATPDDGVRAHFNHMCAYIGLAPVGEPHDRYYIVKNISWAGSIKTIEELGCRWAPELTYGYSLVINCLKPMENMQ